MPSHGTTLFLATSAIALALPAAAADGLDPGDFSCRASALRAEGPVVSEPVVANDPDVPCQDSAAVLAKLLLPEVTATALAAETKFTDPGLKDGTVASAFALAGEAGISALVDARVLVSQAQVSSVAQGCELRSFSFVGSATVAGVEVQLGDGHQQVEIPGIGTVHFNATLWEDDRVTQRALWFESANPLVKDLVVAEASAAFEGANPCASGQGKPQRGLWMTGGGSILGGGTRTTHGFKLECDAKRGPNRLEVNWDGGNKFHLETLERAQCTDDPAIRPDPPAAAFDTHEGQGRGRLNGVSGAKASWKFTDAGQPGLADRATIVIRDNLNRVVLQVEGTLERGNHQAHGAAR